MAEVQRGELATDVRSLSERLDGPIEDVSIGVSALLTKIVRQSIKGGIQKLDESLEDSVRAKIDEDIERRGPDLDQSARNSAKAEVGEQVERLRKQAKESGARIMAQIDSIDQMLRSERDTRQEIQTEIDSQISQLRQDWTTGRGELDGNLRKLVGDLGQAKTEASAGRRKVEEHLERVNEVLAGRCEKLEHHAEKQHRYIEKLEAKVAEQSAKLAELGKLDARMRTVEEKVFAPGFFGRLFGKKPQIPESD